MKLDCSPLASAVGQLERSLGYLHSELAREDPGLREQFRAAAIQAFEFSYELAVKMIRRQLAAVVANPEDVHRIDFADLMRDAAGAGIIRDARSYVRYREMRNRTAHTYNVERAEEAVSRMPAFLEDVQLLLAELEKRNP